MGHSVGGFQARNGHLVEYSVVQSLCAMEVQSEPWSNKMDQNQFLLAESVSEPEPAERKLPAQASPPPTEQSIIFWAKKCAFAWWWKRLGDTSMLKA